MPKIDIPGLPTTAPAIRSPAPPCNPPGSISLASTDTLKPGAASALRHWHEKEDELVYVLQGEVVLIEDEGETVLKPGDAAGFKANTPNGHQLINRTRSDAVYLEIGTRSQYETAHYPDVDLVAIRDEKGMRYGRKNGEPYK